MSTSPLFIMYGSATGNSEHIAKDLAKTAKTLQINHAALYSSVICCELDQFKRKASKIWDVALPQNQKYPVIIISSTTGNGDVPENAGRFVRYLKRKSTIAEQPFQNCVFSVLGLGDTNYDQFCATGKLIDSKLGALGGTRGKGLGMADEATGLEDVVEPYVASVLGDLERVVLELAAQGGDKIVEEPKEEEEKKEDVPVRRVPVVRRAPAPKVRARPVTPAAKPVEPSRGMLILQTLSKLKSLPTVPSSTLPTLVQSTLALSLSDTPAAAAAVAPVVDIVPTDRTSRSTDAQEDGSECPWTFETPYKAPIVAARYLTQTPVTAAQSATQNPTNPLTAFHNAMPLHGPNYQPENEKRVLELTIGIPDGWEYQPGDSIGMLSPPNPTSVVNTLLTQLKANPAAVISLEEGEITVRDALTYALDIQSLPKKRELAMLANCTSDKKEANALRLLASKTPLGSKLYDALIVGQHISLHEIPEYFPTCQPTLDLLWEMRGKNTELRDVNAANTPRYYSVSSSPLVQPKTVQVCFAVVDYLTPKIGDLTAQRRIGGVITAHLETLVAPLLAGKECEDIPTVSIFPKPTEEFHLPVDLAQPLILVGPGTGVAPFHGFLSHRAAQRTQTLDQQQLGPMELFFGCRTSHDELFSTEITHFQTEGVLTHYHQVHSRTGNDEKYVQHVMLREEIGKRLVQSVTQENGCVYICGDGNHMGKDVQEAFVTLLTRYGDLKVEGNDEEKEVAARSCLENLKSEKRFLLDIWS
mmetsp:Transcript_1679/g.1778  ORF Transcript_1679/g.1778 Transcript_1679/m.1778 type:complete len:757 (+) Transcript_1679:124-2394(+)